MWPQLLTSIVPSLIDRIFPDKAKADEAKLKLLELQQQGALAELEAQVTLAKGQLDANTEQAKSSDPFVSRPRPFIMWICGVAFGYAAIIEPVMRFAAQVVFGYAGPFPTIDTNLTMQVLFGLLGLGALRSYDKKNGVAS